MMGSGEGGNILTLNGGMSGWGVGSIYAQMFCNEKNLRNVAGIAAFF